MNYEDLNVISYLGRGTFGVVKLVDYKGEKFAVKETHPTYDSQQITSNSNEIKILSKLSNENIVGYIDHLVKTELSGPCEGACRKVGGIFEHDYNFETMVD